jgi:glutathione S-transferase
MRAGASFQALRRAKYFREERIPKFLGWFGRILARNPEGAGQLVGSALTYADLSLFQIVEGLVYAFPRRMQRTLGEVPRLAALHQAIAQRRRIQCARITKPQEILSRSSHVVRRSTGIERRIIKPLGFQS